MACHFIFVLGLRFHLLTNMGKSEMCLGGGGGLSKW